MEAWGRNDAGQITVPVGLDNVIAIAAGAYHNLALQGDGTVVSWGWNSGGQSIVTATIVSITDSTHYQLTQSLPAVTNDFTYGGTTVLSSITAGASHVLALRTPLIPAQVARLDQNHIFTGKIGIRRSAGTAPRAAAMPDNSRTPSPRQSRLPSRHHHFP